MFNICICRIRCVTGSRNGEGFGPIKLLAVTLQQWIFDYKVHIHSTFSQHFQKHSVTNLLKDIILQMLKIVIIHLFNYYKTTKNIEYCRVQYLEDIYHKSLSYWNVLPFNFEGTTRNKIEFYVVNGILCIEYVEYITVLSAHPELITFCPVYIWLCSRVR